MKLTGSCKSNRIHVTKGFHRKADNFIELSRVVIGISSLFFLGLLPYKRRHKQVHPHIVHNVSILALCLLMQAQLAAAVYGIKTNQSIKLLSELSLWWLMPSNTAAGGKKVGSDKCAHDVNASTKTIPNLHFVRCAFLSFLWSMFHVVNSSEFRHQHTQMDLKN